jgi:Cellulose binding domain
MSLTTTNAHQPVGRRHRWRATSAAVSSAALVIAAVTAWSSVQSASAATLSASVSVSAGQSLAAVPDTLVGANLAVWDGLLSNATTGSLMKNAGIKYLRYPGGSYGDIFHWQTGTADGGYVAPNTSFDEFMTMSNGAGAKPVIIVNYGSGTAQEAADWVRYANITKGYGIKYWEIGNEVYGNGHYGASWERDDHADKSPKAYAQNSLAFISAMKAVDPTIKVGVVVTTPQNWPDGSIAAGDTADWNATVLSTVGTRADFVIPHFYPGSTSEADLLTKPQTLTSIISDLKTDLRTNGAPNAQIFLTETNGGQPRDTQPQALWAADTYLTAAEAGVANVDWWNVHNGGTAGASDSTGAVDYNDEGIISNGSGGEPAAQTPFRTYYGIQMLSRVLAAGDTLVQASSNQAKVTAHAVKRAGGGLDVLLINKDNANSYTVNLSYSGFSAASGVTVDTLGLGAAGITTTTTGTSSSQVIPPYSLVAVHLKAGSGATPSATPSTTPSATPSVTPSTPPSTTAAPAGPGCTAAFKVDNSWSGGFQGSVSVQAGSAAIRSWSTRFTLPSGVGVSQVWNGILSISGSTLTVGNASYNGALAAGATAGYGFIGSGTAPTAAVPVTCSAS